MNKNTKMDSLQAIRAIAAITVLIYHATVLFREYLNYEYLGGTFNYGFLGVDIFFVLSGFIIFYIHHSDIGHKERIGSFYKKRFIRIYPIYWLITCAIIPVYFIVPSFGEGYERNIDVIIKSLLLIPQNHDPILGVGWSLVYEIFFYVLFSILIATKRTISVPIFTIWILAVFYSVIFITPDTFESMNYLYQFFFNPIHLEFLLGCLIAFIVLKFKKINSPKLLIFFGILWLLISMFSQHNGIFAITRLDITRVIAYGLPSFFIIFGFVMLELRRKVKVPGVLTYLGEASYSIYLLHFPLMSLLNKLFIHLNVFDTLGRFTSVTICITITLFICCLFHSLIEKPLLNFTRVKLFSAKMDQQPTINSQTDILKMKKI